VVNKQEPEVLIDMEMLERVAQIIHNAAHPTRLPSWTS
jgi:hypothetical protein